MLTNRLSLTVGGPAGRGIFVTGEVLGKALHRAGLWVVAEKQYPSLIKGGHNSMTLRAEPERIHSIVDLTDVLIAVDPLTVEKHEHQLTEHGIIILDEKLVDKIQKARDDTQLLTIPLQEILAKAGGLRFENIALAGAAAAAIRLPRFLLEDVIRQKFAGKGDAIIEANLTALREGYAAAERRIQEGRVRRTRTVEPIPREERRVFLTTNDAISIAAVKAGVKLVAEYPMTPSSSILHFMAKHELDERIIVKHTEDELAAVNMLIGGAFAGLRVMTATSGGGLSLMSEGVSFAGMAEQPIVIIESQRAGPSTGMPTQTEQGDLLHALHTGQGDFPRVVITPGDPEEAFYETFYAFNIAEAIQSPVIILIDKHLSSSLQSIPRPRTDTLRIDRGMLLSDDQIKEWLDGKGFFKRYAITPSGASPRARPGQPLGMHVASSYEHDETGYTTEEPALRVQQVEKRQRKLRLVPRERYALRLYGASREEADVLIISWGSTKLAVCDALPMLEQQGVRARFAHIPYALPLDREGLVEEILHAPTAVIFETNVSGQMRQHVRRETGILIPHFIARYDGKPFHPWDIVQGVLKSLERKDQLDCCAYTRDE